MIAYQTVSGAGNATGFAESMHTLVEHLEARKQQLAAELDETNAAIEVLKRLGKGDSGTKDTALASSESSLDQNGKTTSRRGRRAANPSKKTADLTTEEDEKRSGFSPRTSVLRSFHGKNAA
ncbi:MAG: hypothetical protein HC780_14300 [Leptolyngbyaceae cyanobacterium CSU_1_3]|nr:hypothetical protein [Leptolyngbyaceae cyanobacterium CSU_1_3]